MNAVISTGMRAKLYLLLAMSYDAELLVLDEPTAGLDVISRNELLDRIRDYMEPGFRFTNASDVIDKLGIS